MRTRNGNPQDHDVERELAAVDATLGGQPVEAAYAELAELVLVLQAEAPRPRPGFADRLDAQMAAGFPPKESQPAGQSTDQPRRFRGSFWPGRMQLAVGTAASLLIVATALVSSGVLTNETKDEQSKVITSEPAGGGSRECVARACPPPCSRPRRTRSSAERNPRSGP